ncbi:MAG: hypothetical protein Q9204_003043 [Flavoplaca sp. TL-2023a]
MPPLRTTKKNHSAVNSKSLLAYGFRGTPDRATNFKGCGMSTDPSVDVTSPTTPTTQIEPASKSTIPKPGPTKLLGKGERIADFRNDTHDWDGKYHLKIGTSTRKITLGSGFALENKHIDQLLTTGPRICENLTEFVFNYADVSYGARDSAHSLTDEAVARLAKVCPKLQKVQLQGTKDLTDEALTAFLRYCLNLTSLEITESTNSSCAFSGAALETLQLQPDRLPKLKKLILPQRLEQDTRFMKAMRSLTKARTGLTVQLVSLHEFKKHGDWEVDKRSYTYKKGRKQDWLFDSDAAETAAFIDDLRRLISKVHASGSFAAFGTIDSFVNPGIFIDRIGIVRLPLSEDDAQALVQTSHKAPFGKGNETLVDESVRKTWQIDAANFQILNKAWQACLDRILERVTEELGIAGGPSSIRAEPYKMLLYEKGAMFKPHQDTEKVAGMQMSFTRSASALDARIGQFTQALTRWQELVDDPHYLAYPLDHQYTDRDLKLAHLKGGDFYRARHIVQSCEAHGEYYMLLGNMEMCITNQNSEEEMEDEAVLSLDRLVDPQGFNLLIGSTLRISTDNLLRGESYEDREPNTQRGGNYLGNQYAEIDQFFKDSTLIIIPSHSILHFLLGNRFTLHFLDHLTSRLRGFVGQTGDSSFRGLLLQVCQSVVERDYTNDEDRDMLLGPVAVSAAFLKNPDLFNTITSQIKGSFVKNYYFALGGLTCFDGLSAQENEFVSPMHSSNTAKSLDFSINTAITKCGKIYQIHENLNAFRDGFFKEHPNRSDQLEVNSLKRWLDALLYRCLYDSEHVCEQDASTLVKIIVEREGTPFSQQPGGITLLTPKLDRKYFRNMVKNTDTNCSILYQGVRTFIEHFQNNNLLINPLVIELLSQSNHQDRSKSYFDTLLRKIIDSAISNFNLCGYAKYIASLVPPNQSSYPSKSKSHETTASASSSRLAGPIKAFYEYASAHKHELPALLLQSIQVTATDLTVEQSNGFLISFLSELIPVADTCLKEAKSCMRSLISLHITRTVGYEPKKPSDWTRLEETTTCHCQCDDCSSMNTFLKDPKESYYALGNGLHYHLKPQFHYFKYFDVGQEGQWGTPLGVTKTNKWWEEQHPQWQTRVEAMLHAIMKLPQDKLKECFGDEYDGIMDLRIVKVVDDAVQSDLEENPFPDLESTVPQKRRRGISD